MLMIILVILAASVTGNYMFSLLIILQMYADKWFMLAIYLFILKQQNAIISQLLLCLNLLMS